VLALVRKSRSAQVVICLYRVERNSSRLSSQKSIYFGSGDLVTEHPRNNARLNFEQIVAADP
jgi:hypothetical protein